MNPHRSTRHPAYNYDLSFTLTAALVVLASYIQIANAQDYDYTGGVALRYPNETCPYNTDYIGTSYYANCCPSWTTGSPSGSGYCCESKADCYVTVASAPKCADQSWQYCYDPKSDAKIGFCCLGDWQCFVEYDESGNDVGGVGCVPPGQVLASTQVKALTSLTAYQIPGATSTSSAATTSSQSTRTTATSATASASTSAASTSSSSLSTGAKAGIGVGAAIGGLALLGLVAWASLRFFRKRQDRVAPSAEDLYGQSAQEYGYGYAKVAPSMGEMSSVHYDPRELDGQAVHRSELEGSHGAQEVGAQTKWR